MTEEKKDYPTSVAAPEGDITPLTLTMVGNLLTMSRESPRKRMLQRIHKSHDAGVHKMFNALQPGTYVTPHRHMNPEKTETILVISGSMLFVQFDEMGKLLNHTLVQPGTEVFGIDVAPHIYHTFIALKPDTLLFEIKDGPYDHDTDKDIPDWAPREGSEEAELYLLDLIKLLAEQANAAAEQLKEEAPQDS
ncbi:WbuC family cupin fold metalloprotein [uncultured Pseudodesulfovibrio sp.]|uniref:WbuC family cupin fold metalloprotein n=1 Tax=uncultured Pseudodesulfovibrio sp. TaxID=2035858 RepID=UPI0029C92F3F|nr:WbuC family cupin fold metalloprotein [uncultured Pseudodesulfovibrio sp.]